MTPEEAQSELDKRRSNTISREEAIAELARRRPQNADDVLISLGLGDKIEGINQNQEKVKNRKGLSGLATDAARGAYNAIPAGIEFLYDLPKNLWDAAKLTHQDPELANRYVKAGSASFVGGALNAPGNIVDYAKEKELAPSWAQAMRPELPKDFDYLAAEGLTEPNKGGEFLYGAAQFLPNAPFGALAPAAWAIEQNQNPVTAQLMPKVSGKIAKQIANTTKSNAPKIGRAIKNVDLTPSGQVAKYVKNNISLSELADNMRAAAGTNTGLGDVVKSPKYKRQLENDLANKEPYGVEQTYKKINDQIQEKADTLLFDEIGKGLPDQDINPMVKDVLRKSFEDNREIKNNLYNEASDLFYQKEHVLKLTDFQKAVRTDLKAIQDSPLLKSDAKFRSLFNKLAGIETEKVNTTTTPASTILNEQGKPYIPESIEETVTNTSIKDANLFANTIYSEGELMEKSPAANDRSIGALYKRLGTALREDVQRNINETNDPAIIKATEKAKEYYKDEFVQFLDKDLYKLLDRTKNPDAIVRGIIKPSVRHDNAALIKKVQAVLPADQQGLLGYTYLRGALQKSAVTGKYELKPAAMKALVKALGTKQFEALFPDANIRRAILDFTKLHDMNSEAASYLINPKTGARNQGFLKQMAEYIPEIIISGGSAASGGPVGAILGLIASKMAKTASNKYMLKLLTSEEFRNKVGEKVKNIKNRDSDANASPNINKPAFDPSLVKK